ncbi:MAG TPA: peroxiredoxin, partial [Gammaproteobacteria bacterium]|nr:peroxiredoxin [Gammaproteobacteria bacterium]
MKTLLASLFVVIFCTAAICHADTPPVGTAAPVFKLQDQNGEWQSLADYKNQWVVLYFYPKDDTPGCTTEACNFRDAIFKFNDMNVQVLGVSLDDVESHAAFAEKYHLPFPLLADTSKKTARAYGVLSDFGPFEFASRETFVINPQGVIAKHYEDVDPETHTTILLADLQ